MNPTARGESREVQPSRFTLKSGLDLLDSARDEIVDRFNRFYGELGRREAIHEDLKCDGEEGPTACHSLTLWALTATWTTPIRRCQPPRHRPVRYYSKPGRQKRHISRITAVHHDVHRRNIHRRVHHKRPGRVYARLL